MHLLEDELEQGLVQESEFKRQNAEFLASYSSDCRAVEEIMAGLEPPEQLGKLTVDQRKSWLTKQRKANQFLVEAIRKQHDVAFQNENNHIKVEMLAKRIEGIRAVLALKTAQIRFLTFEDTV